MKLMRCPYCGLLQDEPQGVKTCVRCGGGLEFENQSSSVGQATYLNIQMELDQVNAPAGKNVERYLLITIRTPKVVPADEAAPSSAKRLPINFAAVLDVSGSMQGDKIVQAKEAVRQAVRCLHSGDIFSLVTFANDVHCSFKPKDVDEQTTHTVESALNEVNAGGMTALCGGLEMGIDNALNKKKDTNLVMLLSDGQANVGETDLEKVGMRAFQARERGLLVSSLGVGLDYNEALMTEIATQGGGRFYHIQDANKIPAFVAGELGEAAAMAARDAKIRLNIPTGATLVPLSGAYPVKQTGDQAEITVGDLPCDIEQEISLRVVFLAQAVGAKLSLDGTLEFRSPAGNELTAPVNRVTVRFVESGSFQLRDGVVQPVAERIFVQLKSASVLGVARARALNPSEAETQTGVVLAGLHAYADKLGEGRAEAEENQARDQFAVYAASPVAAKQAQAAAFMAVRQTKDFNKGKK